MERATTHFLSYCIIAGWVAALVNWTPIALMAIGLMIIMGTAITAARSQ